MIEQGAAAPDFTLADQHGEDVTLSDLRGKTVVLYFYPKADTPGCTKQACGVRDRREHHFVEIVPRLVPPVRIAFPDRLHAGLVAHQHERAGAVGVQTRRRHGRSRSPQHQA